MTHSPRRVTAFVVALAVVLCTGEGLGQRPARLEEARTVPDRPRAFDGSSRFVQEETILEDVYARLMRYQLADIQLRAAASGQVPAAADYLVIGLSDIRAFDHRPAFREAPTSISSSPTLRLRRAQLCHETDPCHVYVQVEWALAENAVPLERGAIPPGQRYATYTVHLTLNDTSLTYQAVAVYGEAAVGLPVPSQIVDPVIPQITAFISERSPAAVAPWDEYVASARYPATVRESLSTGNRRPTGAPIGWLPGDDSASAQASMGSRVGFAPPPDAQVCCNVCAPFDKNPHFRYASFNIAELTWPYFNWFNWAVGAWYDAGGGRLHVGAYTSGGAITVKRAAIDPPGGPWAVYDSATSIIWLFPRLLSWSDDNFIQSTMKHEVGHAITFDDVPANGGWYEPQRTCGYTTTIMYISGPPAINYMTDNDRCAIRKYFP